MYTEAALLQVGRIDDTKEDGGGDRHFAEHLEALRKEVTAGFLDGHSRANKNAAKALEVASFCYALVELLEEKGLITFEELDERQKAVNKRLMRKFTDQGMGVVALQEFDQDKYQFNEEVEIDCENRVHLCRAACCRLELALSKQDIEEGIVKWNLGKPYLIARDADGYCRHLDRESRRCSVWRQRPIPCRGYDCREDERVWLDFENGIVNPKLDELLSQAGEAAE
jgi:Fe-S-cluster formation regulator IscX/YfhJ